MALGPDDLAGLPDLVAAAAQAAAERGPRPRRHAVAQPDRAVPAVLAAARPARDGVPRLGRARRERRRDRQPRDRRRDCWRCATSGRGCSATRLRRLQARPKMAKTPEAVRDLLMAVWAPARARREPSATRCRRMIARRRRQRPLEPWDWRYYAASCARRSTTSTRRAEALPASSTSILEAAFDVAGRLFGAELPPRTDVPVYHPDARVWEVRRATGTSGVFIGDYFARPSKRSGAWCSSFRGQHTARRRGAADRVNVCNFAKAPEGEPAC